MLLGDSKFGALFKIFSSRREHWNLSNTINDQIYNFMIGFVFGMIALKLVHNIHEKEDKESYIVNRPRITCEIISRIIA